MSGKASSRKWKGWIPTVLGNLSFSLVGRNGKPFRFYKALDEGAVSWGAVFQKRIPPDVKIPLVSCLLPGRWYLPLAAWLLKLRRKERFFRYFLLIYDRDEPETVSGAVQRVSGSIHLFVQLDFKQRRILKAALQSPDGRQILEDFIQERKAGADGENPVITIRFSLDRQGFCELGSVEMSGRDQMEEAEQDAAADIGFYFLRDVFHTHKHHHRWEERLLHAYPATADPRWAEQAVKDLLRYLIRHRQEAGERVLGVFSYLETLICLLEEKAAAHSDCVAGQYIWQRVVNLPGLKASIENELQVRRHRRENRRWLITVVLVLLGMVLLYTYRVDEWEVWLTAHPAEMFSLFAGLGVATLLVSDLFFDSPLAARFQCVSDVVQLLPWERVAHFFAAALLAVVFAKLALTLLPC